MESSRRGLVKAAGEVIVPTALGAGADTAQSDPERRGVRWGFLMVLHRCNDCLACVVACKTEFEVPLGAFRCAVKEYEHGRFPNTRRAYIPTWIGQRGRQFGDSYIHNSSRTGLGRLVHFAREIPAATCSPGLVLRRFLGD